ncbi:hypothetical protein MKCMC460_45670 [Mycobacterium sp. 20KCMC460]|nr:hypothetical protein IWGMT90018_46210 [Mycobacterium kiyosense]BDE15707.1 hypothetical protein MKCMC460_45670 [Mycobacterium sp. 20KCMC460]GLD16297.1 hypothetical protein Mkiyose1385_03960 [Mycobacterium kiyosense]
MIAVKKVLTCEVRACVPRWPAVWPGSGRRARGANAVGLAVAGANTAGVLTEWWALVWCSAADAGRSGATGADGSASGRKRRERSEARKVAAELSLVLNVW